MAVADPSRADVGAFGRFCSSLKLENGDQMELEPFQQVMLREYFAGCTETLILIAKKNGKTSLIAALSIFHVLTTSDAECVIAASSADQATVLLGQARGLIERSPVLEGAFKIRMGFKQIRSTRDNGRIRVLASDADTADGVIPTLAIVDELHRHRNSDLYAVFRDGLGPRSGQIITISTAGSDMESPLGVMRKAAYGLPDLSRDGCYRRCATADENFVMHEWALDAGDDLDDIDLVKHANPASWQTVEKLRARHDSPTMNTWEWCRFACGIWVRGYEGWIPRYRWDAKAWNVILEEHPDESPSDLVACDAAGEIPKRADVVLAFDGSWNGDATGIVVCTVPARPERELDDEELPRYLGAPPHVQVWGLWERPRFSADDWTVPVLDVEASIRAACRYFRVREIACDPARWQRSLEILKAEHRPVVEFPQHPARMIPATTMFHTAIMRSGGLTHSGDERLGRHVENAVVNIKEAGGQLSKPSKTSELKIDLAVCAVMAFARAHEYRPRGSVDVGSVYEEVAAMARSPQESFDESGLPPLGDEDL